MLALFICKHMILNCANRLLNLSRPHVMGILNVTPDSFSDGGSLHSGRAVNLDAALNCAEKMVKDGASIIDIGGESTRPGASSVSVEEELDRVLPVVEAVASRLDVVISVDTSQPKVIEAAAAAGAGLINDVRALRLEGALEAAAKAKLPVCLMHMQGNPATMQHNPEYGNCVEEVYDFLWERIQACKEVGLDEKQILVDPGIGFGKRDEHNLALVKSISRFSDLGAGTLFGVSRKSMIGRLLERELPDRLAGSLAFAMAALNGGAKVLRVHDVAQTVDIVKTYELLQQ